MSGPDMNLTPGESHPLVSFVAACFWVVRKYPGISQYSSGTQLNTCDSVWLLDCARWIIAFASISIPRFIIALLSYSLTLTVCVLFLNHVPSLNVNQFSFWSLALSFAVIILSAFFFIRLRYLGGYEGLSEPPLQKANANELHPDVNGVDPPAAFHDYLDEFLQAIRVFGFLEKPVFHELARHVQTRRLVAGDSLSLDEDKSFYCVMDGFVQVFAKTGQPNSSEWASWDNEGLNGYQLLNEVGSGGTLSSLFTILSLFTEDVQISWQEDPANLESLAVPSQDPEEIPFLDLTTTSTSSFEVVNRPLVPGRHQRSVSMSSSGSTAHPVITGEAVVDSPKQVAWRAPSVVSSNPATPKFKSTQLSGDARTPSSQFNHGTVARATVDTTLAVIPAEAFRRLTKKFPKSAGHIVQGPSIPPRAQSDLISRPQSS